MPTPEEFEDTLDQIARFVEETGDEIEQESIDDLFTMEIRGEDYSFRGHRCTDGELIYLIAGHPDHRFMSILYFLSVTMNTANLLDAEIAQAVVGESSGDERELREEAAEKLLNQIPRSDMEALKSYVYMFVSGGTHETNIYSNEQGSIEGFHTAKMIFPYEDSFNIREFYDSVTSVTGTGERGNRLLSRSIFIDKDDEVPSETELNLNFSW